MKEEKGRIYIMICQGVAWDSSKDNKVDYAFACVWKLDIILL